MSNREKTFTTLFSGANAKRESNFMNKNEQHVRSHSGRRGWHANEENSASQNNAPDGKAFPIKLQAFDENYEMFSNENFFKKNEKSVSDLIQNFESVKSQHFNDKELFEFDNDSSLQKSKKITEPTIEKKSSSYLASLDQGIKNTSSKMNFPPFLGNSSLNLSEKKRALIAKIDQLASEQLDQLTDFIDTLTNSKKKIISEQAQITEKYSVPQQEKSPFKNYPLNDPASVVKSESASLIIKNDINEVKAKQTFGEKEKISNAIKIQNDAGKNVPNELNVKNTNQKNSFNDFQLSIKESENNNLSSAVLKSKNNLLATGSCLSPVVIKILSTWGSSTLFGLTEIQVFDHLGKKIDLLAKHFHLRSSSLTSLKNIYQIIDGHIYTTDEKHMLTFHLPPPPYIPEISLNIPLDITVSAVRIWNYNKSPIESLKGIRECKIFVVGNEVFNGELVKAPGNDQEEYCTEIKVDKNVILPKLEKLFSFEAQKQHVEPEKKPEDFLTKIRPVTVPEKPPWMESRTDKKPRDRKQQPQTLNDANSNLFDDSTNVSLNQKLQGTSPTHTTTRRRPTAGPIVGSSIANLFQTDQVGIPTKKDEEELIENNGPNKFEEITIFNLTNLGRIPFLRRTEEAEEETIQETIPKKEKLPAQIKIDDDFLFKNIENKVLPKKNEFQELQDRHQKFMLPNLPSGTFLNIKLFSTWSDRYYVGLNGIEFFDQSGKSIHLLNPLLQLSANPPDINILPGYGKDPRVVTNLVNNNYNTCDDFHLWLAPFQEGKYNEISIKFDSKVTLSMIRIWNYNKSRIHSLRGAKEIAIEFDNTLIFLGEIKKASGSIRNIEDNCEVILFTDDSKIWQQISGNDWVNKQENVEAEETKVNFFERPPTSESKFSSLPNKGVDGRPMTSAVVKQNPKNALPKQEIEKNEKILAEINKKEKQVQERRIQSALEKRRQNNGQTYRAKKLSINFLESWGDSHFMGLNGIEIIGPDGRAIPIRIENVYAKPRDLAEKYGKNDDKRKLENLFNGKNLSQNDEDLWLIPYEPGKDHILTITFDYATEIKGIKIWNYCKSSADMLRGIKRCTIKADEILISPTGGIFLRIAPGSVNFNFEQYIEFPYMNEFSLDLIKTKSLATTIKKDLQFHQHYLQNIPPIGMSLKFLLLTTCGDFFFIGLDSIQIFDLKGDPIFNDQFNDFTIKADPSSINDLLPAFPDSRTVDNLVTKKQAGKMWLAPYINQNIPDTTFNMGKTFNQLYILFNKPVGISGISIWNYSKTPERGVNEFMIFMDNNLIFSGVLKKWKANGDKNVIAFTHDASILQKIQFTRSFFLEKQQINYVNEKDGNRNFRSASSMISLQRPQTRFTN